MATIVDDKVAKVKTALSQAMECTEDALYELGLDQHAIYGLAAGGYTNVHKLRAVTRDGLKDAGLAPADCDLLISLLQPAQGAGGAAGVTGGGVTVHGSGWSGSAQGHLEQRVAQLESYLTHPIKRMRYTVTTYGQAGGILVARATHKEVAAVMRAIVPRNSLPPCMTEEKKRAWQTAGKESVLQGIALEALTQMIDMLRPGGTAHIIDAHASGYSLPSAKPDFVLGRYPEKAWMHVMGVIELKVSLTEALYKDAVGEIWDRTVKVLGVQKGRGDMLSLVWSQDQIAAWRIYASDAAHVYGPVSFSWSEDSKGYQLLAAYVTASAAQLGYQSFSTPPDCSMGNLQLTNWRVLAGASTKRWVFVAHLTEGGVEKEVVVKTGSERQMEYEISMFLKHPNEPVLPRLLHPSREAPAPLPLPMDLDGCSHCFIMELGEHPSEDIVDKPTELVDLLTDVALGLGRMAAAGTVHRDISPENLILIGGRAKVLDLGVALRFSQAGRAQELGLGVTGKPLYQSLRLHQGGDHSLTTDLESLWWSFVYYASKGRVQLAWGGLEPAALYLEKFTSIFEPNKWSMLLEACNPCYRLKLQKLHGLLFADANQPAGGAGVLLRSNVTANEFVLALRDTPLSE